MGAAAELRSPYICLCASFLCGHLPPWASQGTLTPCSALGPNNIPAPCTPTLTCWALDWPGQGFGWTWRSLPTLV